MNILIENVYLDVDAGIINQFFYEMEPFNFPTDDNSERRKRENDRFNEYMSEKFKELCLTEKNGKVFGDVSLSNDLVAKILTYVDVDSLLKCHLVCKSWFDLIEKEVWRVKASSVIGRTLPENSNLPWLVYYFICQNVFERNLLKNHSGERGNRYWITDAANTIPWDIENPPKDVPDLPDDPVFEGKKHCFTFCDRYLAQYVDPTSVGISRKILDFIRPPIQASIWYNSVNSYATACKIKTALLTHNWGYIADAKEKVQPSEGDNEWHKISCTLTEYGPGTTMMYFAYDNVSKCKCAGACLQFLIPEKLPDELKFPNYESAREEFPFDDSQYEERM